MKARLIFHEKDKYPDGSLMEAVAWQVPTPVPPTTHGYKYRLVYIRDGRRVVGFDNERGKGDHKHIGDMELPYIFVSIPQLIEDFIAEVRKWRQT